MGIDGSHYHFIIEASDHDAESGGARNVVRVDVEAAGAADAISRARRLVSRHRLVIAEVLEHNPFIESRRHFRFHVIGADPGVITAFALLASTEDEAMAKARSLVVRGNYMLQTVAEWTPELEKVTMPLEVP